MPLLLEVDVTNEDHLAGLPAQLGEHLDHLDGLVHSLAFANPETALGGKFLSTPWSDVSTALQVSAYSLASLTMACKPLLAEPASVVGLTFDATVSWPVYDWMGVSKAALESTSRYLARYLGPHGDSRQSGRGGSAGNTGQEGDQWRRCLQRGLGPAGSAGLGSEGYDADGQGRRGPAQRLLPQDHRGDDPRGWRSALHRRLTALMADPTRCPLAGRSAPPRRAEPVFPAAGGEGDAGPHGTARAADADARDLGAELGLGKARPGAAGSAFRQRFAIRLVTQIVRRLARIGGVTRLAVRTRTGQAASELVVAYPWRNSGRAEALAYGLARVLDGVAAGAQAVVEMIDAEGAVLAAAPLGSAPRLIRPRIPVVAITGTNGKTTTARMIGHIARRAGLSVGWSSTDGVYIDGELIEAGDFSGPSGAGRVLRHPGVELAVTETARGGILRRGVGVAYNDVSVVTNISADHLGVDGIDTLDQLAEVKAVITKITKPEGWCVLNADDPRTFAMRLGTKAQIWVFTRDPDSPSGRSVSPKAAG